MAAIHIKTKVLPGKRIEIPANDLVEGESVDVYIVRSRLTLAGHLSVLDIIESRRPPGIYNSAEEVDEYIRKERDSWES